MICTALSNVFHISREIGVGFSIAGLERGAKFAERPVRDVNTRIRAHAREVALANAHEPFYVIERFNPFDAGTHDWQVWRNAALDEAKDFADLSKGRRK